MFNAPNKVLAVAKLLFLEGVGGGILPRSISNFDGGGGLLIYRKILPTEKNTIQTKKNIQQFNIFFSNEICSLSIQIILLIILLYKVFFYVDFVKWQ